MRIFKVSDLRPALRDACIERGRKDSDFLTALEAVEEWSGWHLGDPSWADVIIGLYERPEATQ